MKTIYKFFIAGCFILISAGTKAQTVYDEEPTAETFIQMQEGQSTSFSISPLQLQNTTSGFTVVWQTINEKDIASFELEAGGDKKSFSSIKTITPGNAAQPANRYQVDINLRSTPLEKYYFRVKTSFVNGKSVYTDAVLVKMKKAR